VKITVKVNARARKSASAVVRDRLKSFRSKATVEEVFPGARAGRRAGLVSVDISDGDGEAALEELRASDEIDYAEPARARTPKTKDDLRRRRT
jgi:hypothetical protein